MIYYAMTEFICTLECPLKVDNGNCKLLSVPENISVRDSNNIPDNCPRAFSIEQRATLTSLAYSEILIGQSSFR